VFLLPGRGSPPVYRASAYTKRDTFVLMNMDTDKYYQAPQVQSAFHLWVKTPENIRFLELWVSDCVIHYLMC
jgi:hypothetical protein